MNQVFMRFYLNYIWKVNFRFTKLYLKIFKQHLNDQIALVNKCK